MSTQGFSIDLRVDAHEMMWRLKNISDKIADKAMLRAMNETCKHVRTQIKRPIAKAMGAKVGAVAKRLTVHFAHLNLLRASIRGHGKPLKMIEFQGTRQNKPGVTSNAYGKQRVYPHTFIATMKGGHTGVFVRRGKRRFPLHELFGPGVPKTMLEKSMQGDMTKLAVDYFKKRLAHHVAFLTTGGR